MLLDVVIEQRFYRSSDGKYWTDNAFPYAFWNRYLSVFSAVNIVARVTCIARPEAEWSRVDGDFVGVTPLPSYIGPWGFVKKLPELIRVIRSRRGVKRKVIYRVPGILSSLYNLLAMQKVDEYAAEVVGDPEDVFAKSASKSVFRGFFKWLFIKLLKAQCAGAKSISYVTEYSLQQRYPPNASAFHTHYSSIQLLKEDFHQRNTYCYNGKLRIVCVGNLTQPYKGCDFMLKTLAELRKRGVDAELRWVGGGYLLDQMKALAKQLNVTDSVTFLGNLAGRDAIRAELIQANLFVLSSRQEGLPRVLIEAMASSLVCIATNVGGVQELLEPQYIVERDNVAQLIAAIESVLPLQEEQLMHISKRNYDKAGEYENSTLESRRKAMYQHLLDIN